MKIDDDTGLEITAQASDLKVGREVLRLMLSIGGKSEDEDAPSDHLLGPVGGHISEGREGTRGAAA